MTIASPLRLPSSFFADRRPRASSPVSVVPHATISSATTVPTVPTAADVARPAARVSAARFVAGIVGALAVLTAFLLAVHR